MRKNSVQWEAYMKKNGCSVIHSHEQPAAVVGFLNATMYTGELENTRILHYEIVILLFANIH